MTTTPSSTIHPKVAASAITSVSLVVILAAIGALSPDLFSAFGPWKGVAYAAVVAIGGVIAGYVKKGPSDS